MSDNELSWDEKANAKAHTQWYNPDHGDGDCMKCQVNFQVREGFEMGAKWQRDQLRTDEAVERVALTLISAEGWDGWPTNEELSGNLTGDRDVEFKAAWMDRAKEVINALLGEEA